MNKQAIIPLAIGLVVGLFAIKLGYDYVKKANANKGTNFGPAQKIIIAAKEIPIGKKLSDEDIEIASMPKKLVPDNAVSDKKELIGKTLRVSLAAKMPILKTMVGPGQGLEGIIPKGYRAVAVKVDEYTGVAGLLRPGVRVDVIATFRIRRHDGKLEHISKVVLQNVEVRAVGQTYRPEDANSPTTKLSRSVTLLIKSDQMETLQLAASTGKIRLALRSAIDEKPAEAKGINLYQLLNGANDKSSPSSKFANVLTGLVGMSFKKKSAITKPVIVKPVIKKPQPFMVELMTGDKMERLYFASENSDQRIQPKQAKGNNNNYQNNQEQEQEVPDLAFNE